METIVIKANKKQSEIVKAFLDQQKVAYISDSFSNKQKEEKPYDPQFVEMVLHSKKGNSTRINPEKLWESIL